MNVKTLHFSIIAISVIVFGNISPIWATADLSVNLSESGAPAQATFKFSESALIEYPNGGKLKDLLAEKMYMINFTENSDNTSVQDLMHQLNTALARDQKSPVIITDLTVQYTATLVGDAKSASIDYNLELIPILTSYVLKKGDSYDNPTIIDAVWMGLAIKDPVVIKTARYGDVEINTPISFVKKVVPDVYSNIQGTKVENTLKNNLIDASSILQSPLDQWDHLFDPAFTISETSSFGYKGQKIAITTYTNMDPNGLQKPTQNTVDFSTDTNYKLTTIQHASSATVNIEGQAMTTSVGGTQAFSTTLQAYSAHKPTWWDNTYPIVLFVIVGFVVTAFWIVFFKRMNWKSDRKFARICIASMGFSVADCIMLGYITALMIVEETMTNFLNVDKGISLWIPVILLWIGFVVLTKKNATSVYKILRHKDGEMANMRVRTIVNMMVIILSTILWSFFIYIFVTPHYSIN